MKRLILLMAIWAGCLTGIKAQSYPVTIKGIANFAANEEIRLVTFEELATYKSVVAATDKIDAKGHFLLTYNIIRPTLVQLVIRTSRAEFYIEPGRTYDFTIDMDPELFNLLDPMSYGGFLQIRNNDTTLTEDINLKINRFERFFENTIDYYSPNIISDLSPTEYDSIRDAVSRRFPLQYSPNNFYKSYIYYTMASLERVVLTKNPDSLYRKYLDNEYLLYFNPAYMNFFNEFYDHYLTTSPRINQKELMTCINQEGTYRPLFNLVGKDPYLVNERIRELVIIEDLAEIYENKRFNKKNIEHILNEIATTTHFAEHQIIAKNTLASIRPYQESDAISFDGMKTASGASFNIEDYKGKWLFVQIFNTSCEDCIREMMIIKELQQKYKDSITFISLSIDFNFGHFIQFKEHFPQFDWTFVHFDHQYPWIDELQITTLPDNLLFGPDGKLVKRDAPDITTQLPLYLARLFHQSETEDNIPLNQNRKP